MDKISYALGIGIGRQLAQMGASKLNIDDFAQAIKDVISDADLKVSDQEAQELVQNFFAEQEAKQRAEAEIAMAEAELKGLEFQMNDPQIQADPVESQTIAEAYAAKEQEIAARYERWEKLTEA